MRFADEVRAAFGDRDLPRRSKADPKALAMAKQVIDGLAGDWDPKQYHDTYTEALRKRISHKQSGKEVVEATEEPKARVLDLMAALEASVDAAKKRRAPAHKADAQIDPQERLTPLPGGRMLTGRRRTA